MADRFIQTVTISLLFCCLFAASPGFAWGKEKLVSVILTGNLERYQTVHKAFLDNLTTTNLKVYAQTPNPDPISLANSVRKAVAIGSDLIVTYGAQAALVAKKESLSVPLLFADVYDPVSLGLVKCLDDVACDISGISASTPMNTLLKLLADLAPSNRRIIAMFSSNDPGSVQQCRTLKSLASGHGFTVETIDLVSVRQLDTILVELASEPRILFVSESALVQKHVDRILKVAKEKQLLVFSQVPGLCEKGALVTLEPGLAEQGQRLAEYATSVLLGVPVRSLPVISPHQVDLVLNLQVAKQHQLSISLNTLKRATRVVK